MQYKKLHTKFGKKLVTGLSLCLSAFLLCGANVNAAEKETPLVNLAEGRTTVKDSNGKTLTNVELLTDEDLYYLQHSANGNKVSGSVVQGIDTGNTGWEAYVEQGAQVEADAEWIQMDLGASYPIEVINLKRRVYDGVGDITKTNGLGGSALKYTDTVIVIGNKADLSDGYVVYYNDDDNSVELPAGVTKPENVANGGLNEQMAGTYFYMDNTNENGTGYTKLGTTKSARYVRVYSDDPDADEDLMFMELAVYGYRSAAKIQGARTKKVINNEHPLMIAAAYSDDQWYLGQEAGVGLQGYNTIAGRWNTVADDLKDNTVLMMHSNNLRSFSPHYIGQAYIHGYYKACLEEAYEAGASTMLMLVNASSYPGGTHWCITRDTDYHWVDLMFRMYPNLESVFSTENFWSGNIGGVANSIAKFLEIVNRYGGYIVYSEEGTGVFNTLANQPALREAVKKYGDSLFYTYKNTAGGNDCLLTQSHIMGSWLAGYTGGWGMLSDSWAWGNNGNGPIYERGGWNKSWKPLTAEPETIYGMQMINTYLSGGVVYTFEFPEVVYGAIDEKSPAYTHVVERVFRYICDNPGPSRKDILNKTKAMVYDAVPSTLYPQTVGADNVMGLFQTGRYGALPSVPTWASQAEVTQKLKETAKKEGASAPVLLSNGDALLSKGGQKYFKSIYPTLEYLGDAFANQYDGRWHIYNSTINSDVDQYAILPLEGGEGTARFKANVEPHTYVVMDEKADGSMEISLNNYRIDAREIIFNNKYNWAWDGSSATGQGVSNAKRTVYRYMAYYNCVNAKKGVLNLDTPDNLTDTIDQLSPNDNALRTTTFELTSLTKAPTVTVKAGQAPDTDGLVQYNDPVVTYDAATKTATITVETNGWIDLAVSDLEFEVDEDAVKIEEEVEEEPEEPEEPETPVVEVTNVAQGKTATGSHAVGSGRAYSKIVDGTTSCGDNDYTNFGDVNEAVWAQIDLGSLHEIEEVQMWRYNRDTRQYKDTVILLSEDSSFKPSKTLVIWNSNANAATTWPNSQGSSERHSLPAGSDSLYTESTAGKAFKVYGENVKWLDGTMDGVPTEEDNRFVARYVRVYMNGSSKGQSNHLIEVKVMGVPYVEPYGDNCNLAREEGVVITASHEPSGGGGGMGRPLTWINDGTKTQSGYSDPGANTGGPIWVQMDLGELQKVEKLKLYRYWDGTRKYHNTIIMLSPDEKFSADSTLVVWNANNTTAGRNGAMVESWSGDGNGDTGSHSIPQGNDGLYTETDAGREFQVYGENVRWLDGSTDGVPTASNNRFKARYVRVYMNGSTAGETNHVIELEVFGEPRAEAPAQGPVYNTNLAVNSGVSGSGGNSGRPFSRAVDGAKNDKNNYTDLQDEGPGWFQIDMGVKHQVNNVALWRYYDNRSYYNTVVMISPDKNFAPDTTLVLWNANGANGGRGNQAVASWPGSGNGQTGTHTLPTGTDVRYNETADGKVFKVTDSSVKWLNGSTDNLPDETYEARYVRIYMNGSGSNTSNHLVEVEVYGIEGKFKLEDTEAPEQVTGIEAVERYATSAVISFLPSMDDMGLKGYEFSVKKQGEEASVIEINQTTYELTGLEPNTTYEVSVIAVDNYDNKSEVSETYTFTTRNENDFVVSASVSSGRYGDAQSVTLSAPAAAEGVIYYTLDGTEPFDKNGNPTATAVEYSAEESIIIAQSCTLHAALKLYGRAWTTCAYFYQIGEEGQMDFDAPAAPTEITVVETAATEATVSWIGSDADIRFFNVYVNGEKAAEVNITRSVMMQTTITDLTPGTAYQVYVTAVDGAGNESIRSRTKEFVTRRQ